MILQGEIWCWSLLGLKGHLKSEFALSFKLYCVYFTSFNPTNVGDFFWRWILKDCIDRSSGREKENRCLVFKSSTKREIRHFQVVVVQRRQRNVRTSVMHMQSCCFAYLNLFSSFPFSLPSPSSGVRAHFGQSIFSFLQQKRKKDILLILTMFAYFKVQKKREKKKKVRKIDHFFIFLILKLNSIIQKILLTAKSDIFLFLFSWYC